MWFAEERALWFADAEASLPYRPVLAILKIKDKVVSVNVASKLSKDIAFFFCEDINVKASL